MNYYSLMIRRARAVRGLLLHTGVNSNQLSLDVDQIGILICSKKYKKVVIFEILNIPN